MPLAPFRFELVFTGLCLFVLDDVGATVLLVNASNPKRFQSDPDLTGLGPLLPNPHFPQISYLMGQQIREGVVAREPDHIFAGPAGEEVGVCDLEGEDLTLETVGASAFQPGSLGDAPKLSTLLPVQLSPLCTAALPNFAVSARFRLTQGALEILRVGFAGLQPLEVDFRTINTKGTPSGNPPTRIADQLVLRMDGLTEPVKISSGSSPSIRLRPDLDANGQTLRPVVASLSNYHRVHHQPQDAAYDFLWFYEMMEFILGPKPSRRNLRIPVYVNSGGGFTGSSGVCPPIRF